MTPFFLLKNIEVVFLVAGQQPSGLTSSVTQNILHIPASDEKKQIYTLDFFQNSICSKKQRFPKQSKF